MNIGFEPNLRLKPTQGAGIHTKIHIAEHYFVTTVIKIQGKLMNGFGMNLY